MNFNSLKQTIRGLKSQKFYFLLNLLGLSIGIAAFILIALWVNTELSYDNFQKDAENIYRVDYKLYEEEILEQYSAAAVPVIGPMMAKTYPEVEEYTRFRKIEGVIKHGDVFFKEDKLFYAESSFFSIFNFPLLEGLANNEILDVNKAVISESTAKRYFGDNNPVGQYLTLNGNERYFVSAVVKDSPSNSHLKFDILLSYENLINQIPYFDEGWFVEQFYTYVKLLPGTNFKAVEDKIPALVEQYLGDFMKEAFFLAEFKLRPLGNIHLHSNLKNELEVNGNINHVKYMSLIAILVLIIAFINYINLTTSHSIQRASEVGVRKVLGAFRKHLLTQFFTESVIVNILAFSISFALVIFLLPAFRNLTGSPVFIPWFILPVGIFILFIISSISTGIIPSLYLSGISPTHVLKGKGSSTTSAISKFRNGLVVFQFSVSVILIVGTLIIGKQMKFLQNQNLGIKINQMLVVEGPKAVDAETGTIESDAFRSEMLKLAAVNQMTISTNVPGEEVTFQPVYGKLITGVNTEKKIRMIGIDQYFFDTYDLQLLAGRNFDKDFSDEIREVILNESALEYLGFSGAEEAIGQELTGDQGEARVIGVINNYNQKSLREKPGPMMFCNRVQNNYYTLQINEGGANQVISELEKQWNVKFKGNPLNYFFLDDYFNKQYNTDKKFGTLFLIFSVLAIFIACLGLLGLSAYSTAQRIKEIGIRKVNGAKITEVLAMLNKDFMLWVIISFIIAIPASYFIMQKWLETFAYKTALSWWIFALAGLLALGIALLTVSWQSWRAATRNPVEALRYE